MTKKDETAFLRIFLRPQFVSNALRVKYCPSWRSASFPPTHCLAPPHALRGGTAAHCATAPVGTAVAPGRDGEDQPAGFRAPGVPYVPCAAIVLNCLLMAQFDGLSHLYLVGFVALFLGGYATFQLFCGEAA